MKLGAAINFIGVEALTQRSAIPCLYIILPAHTHTHTQNYPCRSRTRVKQWWRIIASRRKWHRSGGLLSSSLSNWSRAPDIIHHVEYITKNDVTPFTSAVRTAFARNVSDLGGRTIERRARLLRAGELSVVAPAGYTGVLGRRHRSVRRDLLPVHQASCKSATGY